MEKIFDFFDNHPYIATSIIGAIVTAICCISKLLRFFMGAAFLFLVMFRGAFLLYMIIINIIAYNVVSKGKIKTGIVLSIFGGFVGSFNAEYSKQGGSKAIKIIFTVWIWILICICLAGYIYWVTDSFF